MSRVDSKTCPHGPTFLEPSPIIPFNGLNYIGGVTSVSLKHFTYSLVGMLPTILLWVLAGATSKSLAQKTIDDTSLQVYMGVLLGVGLWVAVLALFITWRIASKELRREIESNSAETWFRYRDDDSQASSHPDDDDEDGSGSGDEGEGEDGATCTGTGTGADESSGHDTLDSIDPTALAALHHDSHAAMAAPHSPENDRAASQLPRPPYHLSPLLPPDSPFSGVFGVLDGDEDDEIIFIPDPGPSATEMYGEHDLEYTEEEADGLHSHHDDYHHRDLNLHLQHPDVAYAPYDCHPSHNWLLSQLGIGYGMDRHDPYGDPRGRDTDPLWLWA
jgi:hypothetical protein